MNEFERLHFNHIEITDSRLLFTGNISMMVCYKANTTKQKHNHYAEYSN